MLKRKLAVAAAVVAVALVSLAAPALASDHRESRHTTHATDRHDKRSNSTWWSELSRGNNRHDRDRDGRDRDRRDDRRDRDRSDDRDDDFDGSSSSDVESDTVDDTSTDVDTGVTGDGTPLTGTEKRIQVETTSYNNADNQGGNNAKICCGVIHREASGDGTFANPITLAVPGSGGKGMQTPAGTRVYFERYSFYGIVEDSGASPKSLTRFDIWSDGRGLSESAGSDCMDALTGTSSAILNPADGKPVKHVGPRADASGCHA